VLAWKLDNKTIRARIGCMLIILFRRHTDSARISLVVPGLVVRKLMTHYRILHGFFCEGRKCSGQTFSTGRANRLALDNVQAVQMKLGQIHICGNATERSWHPSPTTSLSVKRLHSSRSSIAGSTERARCAGIQVASNPSKPIARTTTANTRGSRELA
jgi:hypothetical protein